MRRCPEETSYGALPGYATKIKLSAGKGFSLKSAAVQPLERADHAALVRGWDAKAYERGKVIYGAALCGLPRDGGGAGEFANGAAVP